MASPGSGALRLLRAGALAATCTGLSLIGHGLGGGEVPSPAMLLAVCLVAGAFFQLLADRERGLPEILGGVLAAQAALHVAFELEPSPGYADHAGHAGHPVAVGELAPPVSGGVPDLSMLGWHLLAAVVTAVVLSRGESALWALCHLVGRAVLPGRLPRVTGAATVPLPTPVRPAEPPRPPGVRLAVRAPRRGPPALVGA